MFQSKAQFAALAACLAVAACGGPKSSAGEGRSALEQAGYVTPPSVTAVAHRTDGLLVSGRAAPGLVVRLNAPSGVGMTVKADEQGRWSLALPPAPSPQIFGLSMAADGRQIQGQGYLLTTPGGAAALLRAGAGAVRLDPQPTAKIGAVDFDRDGGVVISGTAPPNGAISVQIDGRQSADARADADGRYSVNLPQLPMGPHRLEVLGDGFDSVVAVQLSPPAPLAGGPLRSQFTDNGLRIDWLTPGGGVQSTLIAG